MLAKFSVKNFRNFDEWVEFSFETDRSYEFNTDIISENGLVKHSMIYGVNGSGKSNLGLAIMDLTCHTQDIIVSKNLKSNYQCGCVDEDMAEFIYEFKFGDDKIVYKYGKKQVLVTEYECLTINEKEVVSFDRNKSSIIKLDLAGTEHLKTDLSSSLISAIKYISSNSVLDEDDKHSALFLKFIDFISGMVFFRTLTRTADYHGLSIDTPMSMSSDIIKNEKLSDFEKFLNECGIKCKLVAIKDGDEDRIAFDYGNKTVEFTLAASTGTLSLGVFYYWWMKVESGELKFVYVDEFDAYYHYKLARAIVSKMSNTIGQTVLTTHNISLLSNSLLRPDSYFVLHENKQYPFYKLVDKELRQAHNLEKIYKGLKYVF
ncbi:SMC domain-containing protein [Shewanella baltica OS625]|uniref:SMC domain protein n=1 Tax=Shewanella baltica (strain OS195) TaxID=399599 RepID=A9KVK6_SHEB9|nr:AAA family ATPase [Shewanella baltica]ABX48746.1 SMC domain protein [Shewanella baltica OS195]ADT93783.1 SMC domain-containing protein [Shewanella baltica OS678]EHC07008.1 SMC domain-containing protein [Shewanella baltica OS625]